MHVRNFHSRHNFHFFHFTCKIFLTCHHDEKIYRYDPKKWVQKWPTFSIPFRIKKTSKKGQKMVKKWPENRVRDPSETRKLWTEKVKNPKQRGVVAFLPRKVQKKGQNFVFFFAFFRLFFVFFRLFLGFFWHFLTPSIFFGSLCHYPQKWSKSGKKMVLAQVVAKVCTQKWQKCRSGVTIYRYGIEEVERRLGSSF